MARAEMTVNANFFDPEVVKNPGPMLEELRAAGPVLYHEAMGVWLIIGFDDIKWCNARHEIFNFPPEWQIKTFGTNVMQGYDTPRHDELRGIWAHNFNRKKVQEYTDYVDAVVSGVMTPFIERLMAGETVDIVDAVARHVPTSVITWLLGVEESRVANYAFWSEEMAKLPQAMIDPDPDRAAQMLADADKATKQMIEALIWEIDRRGGKPTDDLIGIDPGDVVLSKEERAGNLASMAFAGYGTTAKLIGHITQVLAAYPEQRELIRNDRSLVPGAVEEILRWAGIIMCTPRRTTQEVDVHGVTIPAHADLLMMYSTANRDPERWENATELDVTRKPQQHYSLGFGLHHCLGQSLARLEAQTFLNQMLDAVPEWDVPDEVDYGTNFFIRGPLVVNVKAPFTKGS
jgi:cytochrome P450